MAEQQTLEQLAVAVDAAESECEAECLALAKALVSCRFAWAFQAAGAFVNVHPLPPCAEGVWVVKSLGDLQPGLYGWPERDDEDVLAVHADQFIAWAAHQLRSTETRLRDKAAQAKTAAEALRDA